MDVHVYNNLKLMTDFIKKLTRIGRLIVDNISLGCGIVQIRLALKDRQEVIILNF